MTINLNEKRYFLKNANLLEEIHKSKMTYCCYTNEEYTNYDIICVGYDLITPNVSPAVPCSTPSIVIVAIY